MKKSLLALAVAALAATSFASTASATTIYDKDGTSLAVYGRVQAVYYSEETGSGTKTDAGDPEEGSINASGRLGFDLRSQINPYVAGFAKAEFEMSNGNNIVDNGEDDHFYGRYLWVGMDFGQYGQFKVGKFEEAIKYAISQTDIYDDWGCLGLNGNDDRREGVVQYQWNGYGVDVIASYAFAKQNEHLDGAYMTGGHVVDYVNGQPVYGWGQENVDIDYSASIAIGYTSPDVLFGPIAVRAGYLTGEFADPADHSNNVIFDADHISGGGINGISGGIGYDSYDQFALGVSWGSLNLGPYVAAVYQQRTFDLINDLDINGTNPLSGYDESKVTGYEFAVGYNFGNGLLARMGYNYQKYEFGPEEAEAACIPVYVNYNFNPQVQVWAEARFDAGTDDDENGTGPNFADLTNGVYNAQENVFSIGLRYNI